MKQKYFSGLVSILFISWNAAAQTVVVPQSITATVDPYISSEPVTNLTLNITPSVNSNTTFPYSPSTGFSTGTGFVSEMGVDTGTIIYTFANPVSISQMMIWSAYFNFELDHSPRTADLIFKNTSGTTIATVPVTMPEATASDLKPYVAVLPSEVVGVKSVHIQINTLWGGNEISMRRLAFAGTGQTAGLSENYYQSLEVSPNPAATSVVIKEQYIQHVEMTDLNGRNVAIELVKHDDYATVSWEAVQSGMYQLRITTDRANFVSKVMVK